MITITEKNLLPMILERIPYFQAGYAQHEIYVRSYGGGDSPYGLLDHICGRLMDIAFRDSHHASVIGQELGRIYEECDLYAKEALGVAVFEECRLQLDLHADQPGYRERVERVRCILPECGRVWFDAWGTGTPPS